MKTSELWVLEWSQRQNALHIQQIHKTLDFNRKLYVDNKKAANDYRVVHIGSRADCEAMAASCRQTMEARDKFSELSAA